MATAFAAAEAAATAALIGAALSAAAPAFNGDRHVSRPPGYDI